MRKGKDIASPIAKNYVISKHVHTQSGDKRSVENYGVQNKAAGYKEYVHSQTKSRWVTWMQWQSKVKTPNWVKTTTISIDIPRKTKLYK